MLAIESNRAIGLRTMKLMRGGKKAQREAELIVREKIDAALDASAKLMAGASGDAFVRRRRRVAANAKRLTKAKTIRKRSPTPPIKRSLRKLL